MTLKAQPAVDAPAVKIDIRGVYKVFGPPAAAAKAQALLRAGQGKAEVQEQTGAGVGLGAWAVETPVP